MASATFSGFTREEYERRHLAIRERMQLRDIDCLIIAGNESWHGAGGADMTYVSGEAPFGFGPYIVFPLEGEPCSIGDPGGTADGDPVIQTRPAGMKSGKGEGRRLRDYGAGIARQVKELGLESARIGVADMRVMPADVYLDLRAELPSANFVPADNLILECRRVKSAEELRFVREAGKLADVAMRALIEAARPGVTEAELLNVAEIAMIEGGARRGNMVWVSSASWSEREASIAVPGRPGKSIEAGDLIANELTPSVNGYSVQLCVPILVGQESVPDSLAKLLGLHEEMYRLATEGLAPGRTVAEIEREVLAAAASHGDFERVWALQTGELAEAFFRLNYTQLAEGMVWVNHPWTEPPRGEPGHRGHLLGNTLIVADGEPECVSTIPPELVSV